MTTDLIQIAAESTCRKRVTVCSLHDAQGTLLAVASNRCDPPGGVCCRLGLTQGKADYPADSDCRWRHAEVRAIDALPEGVRPVTAVLYGHDFYCGECESALRACGVERLLVSEERVPGTGLRPAEETQA